MGNDVTQAVMATWAARGLPARLGVAETAKLLGFAEHDVQILMASGKLSPLGDPAPNAPKWFAAMEIIALAADNSWLNRATKEISKHWRQKRERQRKSGAAYRPSDGRCAGISGEKVSPKSSPKSSPGERWSGDERAAASDEQIAAKSA
jgi:hypothetical protein